MSRLSVVRIPFFFFIYRYFSTELKITISDSNIKPRLVKPIKNYNSFTVYAIIIVGPVLSGAVLMPGSHVRCKCSHVQRKRKES